MGSSCFLVCQPPENQSMYSIESIEIHIQRDQARMASWGKNPFLVWKLSPSWKLLTCWQHCANDISSGFGESEHCYLEHFSFPKAATWHVNTLETRYIPSSSYKWDTDKGDNDPILRAWALFHSSVTLIKNHCICILQKAEVAKVIVQIHLNPHKYCWLLHWTSLSHCLPRQWIGWLHHYAHFQLFINKDLNNI